MLMLENHFSSQRTHLCYKSSCAVADYMHVLYSGLVRTLTHGLCIANFL